MAECQHAADYWQMIGVKALMKPQIYVICSNLRFATNTQRIANYRQPYHLPITYNQRIIFEQAKNIKKWFNRTISEMAQTFKIRSGQPVLSKGLNFCILPPETMYYSGKKYKNFR